jgi:glycosyltransferase involved in cell wall biosynthesis
MKNQKGTMLSIITVVRNDPDNLEKTVKSVLSQTFKDYEFIVIDGQSDDQTLDVIKKHQNIITLWISEKDEGIYDAMNKGLARSKGKYVEFLNAGDVYADSRSLEAIFSNANKDYDVIYGEINLFGSGRCNFYAKFRHRASRWKT